MSKDVNKVTLIGRLGGEPEIKSLPSGGKVATFSLATSDSWTDKETQEKKERTHWHRVVVFNEPLIDAVVEKYVHKGDKIYLEGAMETRQYQDRDGNDRWSTEVVLRPYRGEINMIESKRTNEPARPNGKPAEAPIDSLEF